MDAGVLPYQLCISDSGCEGCAIDEAMRWHSESPLAAAGEVRMLPSTQAHAALLEEMRYSRNHFWACKTANQRLRFGLEPGLIEVLVNVKGVVFPSISRPVRKGEPCAWAVTDSGTLPLECPFNGVLAAVNHELVAKPHLLVTRPFHDGWLCEIELQDADADLEALMIATEASAKYAMDQQRFRSALQEPARTKRSHAIAGVVDESDGWKSIAEKAGLERYLGIIRQCFGLSGK
jgi:glycine cleavage system H lipoate-binding protein